MNARIEIRDVETNKTLKVMGNLMYENAGKAIQDCERWYADEIEAYEDRGYITEIVLVDIDPASI